MVGGGGEAGVRVLVAPGGMAPGAWAELYQDEAHHLQVRRARAGDQVSVHDGAGLVGRGQVFERDGAWVVQVQSVERWARPAELVLAVGAGDRDRFAWLVEKAVELGVTSVVPLETATTAGVATRVRERHLPKLRRLALEAIKQCGAAWATTVEAPTTLADFARRPREGPGWLADPAGEPPAARIGSAPLSVVVGPEGGLGEAERAVLREAGFLSTALGAHTLRFETAALAAAAVAAAARLRGEHG